LTAGLYAETGVLLDTDSSHRPHAKFWRTVFQFDKSKLDFTIATRNALGTAIPLVAGAIAGSPESGLVAGIGALNVCFSDGRDPYYHRARRMFASSVLVAFAVFVGAIAGASRPVAGLLAVISGFVAGLMVALGPPVSDIAVTSLVTLIVFSAQSLSLDRAAASGFLALAGGLVQTVLSLAFWPLQRHRPERRALADVYRELAGIASAPANAFEPPPGTSEMTHAQDVLSTLHTQHTIEAERYLSLLNQAERIRLRLLTLSRLRTRLMRDATGQPYAELLDRSVDVIAFLLNAIAEALDAAETSIAAEPVVELQALAEKFREPLNDGHIAALVNDARAQLDALAGQLRSAAELASHATVRGELEFVHRQARRHWRLRLGGALATLRAHLTLESSSFRHAVRLAACLAAGEVLAASLGWRRSYWLPMTIALVLKPDFTTTFSRGVLRLGGTFAGLLLTTALFHFIAPAMALEIALITICIFLLRYIGAANYGLLTANVSAMVVMMISLTGIAPSQVIGPRAMNTAVGGVLSLIAYLLWPTWEREQVGDALAELLEAYRRYFHTVREAYLNPHHSYTAELDRTRQAARVARTNAVASVDRVLAEPGTSSERAKLLSAMLASSHRVAHAMMSLEAGLTASEAVSPRADFRSFTHQVELTLHSLAAALRGSPLSPADLPDLREAHHALVAADGDGNRARYDLVNTETDRLTNSLDTLSEQVMNWIRRDRRA
jgi:uncharacterized membrane protein YccC